MATLQTTCITGFLNLCQATSSPSTYCRLWYDTTSNRLQYAYPTLSPGTWSTTGNLNTKRQRGGGTGISNAGLIFGGSTIPPQAFTCYANTEEYNGNSWSNGGALNTARSGLSGAGTQNSALAIAGGNSSEEYNGNSWANGGNLINSFSYRAGLGTQNSALASGGSPFCSQTEEYNGTSWSAGPNMSTGRRAPTGAGTQNAGVVFGGLNCRSTEEYNGNSWSSGPNMINRRDFDLGDGAAQDSALAFGGSGDTTGGTECYNGTSWSALTSSPQDLGFGAGGFGTVNGAVGVGCTDAPTTYEFNAPFVAAICCL